MFKPFLATAAVALLCGTALADTRTARPPEAVRPASAPDTVRFAHSGDRRLAYRVRGSGGTPIVLISGLSHGMDTFNRVAPELARTLTVIVYDRPGYGASTGPSRAVDAQSQVEDLAAVLKSSQVRGPYILVGHSTGGFIAELYAAQHPDDVAGMVLEDVRTATFGRRCEAAGVAGCAPTPQMVRNDRQGTRDEVAGLGAATAQVAAIRPAAELPVLVISRALARSPTPFEVVWSKAQADLAASYPGSTHLIAPSPSHDVHRTDRAWFTAAVRDFAGRSGRLRPAGAGGL